MIICLDKLDSSWHFINSLSITQFVYKYLYQININFKSLLRVRLTGNFLWKPEKVTWSLNCIFVLHGGPEQATYSFLPLKKAILSILYKSINIVFFLAEYLLIEEVCTARESTVQWNAHPHNFDVPTSYREERGGKSIPRNNYKDILPVTFRIKACSNRNTPTSTSS